MTEVKSIKKRRGYMYIGHLPHGFYDKEIREYFTQFGKVRRIRLSRSKKTGNCRGYGFIEFENEKVAKIAADTMNNYLMFNKILKCQLIEKEKLHPNAFRNSARLFTKPVKSWYRRSYNREKTGEEIEIAKKKFNKKLASKQKKFEEIGLDIKIDDLITNTTKKEVNETTETKTEESTVVRKKLKK